MLGQAPHTGLQLLFRQGVEDEVNTLGEGSKQGPHSEDHSPANLTQV